MCIRDRPCAPGGHAHATLAALFDAGFELSILTGTVAGGGYPRCGVLMGIERDDLTRALPHGGAELVCDAIFTDGHLEGGGTLDIYGARPPLETPRPLLNCGSLDLLERSEMVPAGLFGNEPSGRRIEVELVPGLPPIAHLNAWRDGDEVQFYFCLLYTSPSPRDATLSRMPSSA